LRGSTQSKEPGRSAGSSQKTKHQTSNSRVKRTPDSAGYAGLGPTTGNMMGNDRDPKCMICGLKSDLGKPLIPEGYYQDVLFHIQCLNSDQARAWRIERMRDDPGYKRYMDLTTAGQKQPCLICGYNENYLYPKFVSHAPGYEVCCCECSNYSFGLNPYSYRRQMDSLLALMDRFLMCDAVPGLYEAVHEIAEAMDKFLEGNRCSCGARFSFEAKPRCNKCHAILVDSYFHYVDSQWRQP
jgi:hypothetical protein